MFSYRHGFHAGNHADVLKHVVLAQIIDYFNEKPAPYWYIDTHAGAGVYDLTGQWANTRQEYLGGIGRILAQKQHPDLLHTYLQVIRELNDHGQSELQDSSDSSQTADTMRVYPGSPWVALNLIRPTDRIKLFEKLPVEADILKRNLAHAGTYHPRQIQVSTEDGFLALKALLPPSTRRAVTLIDPSYENKQDYRHTLDAVKDAITRFPTGCYMVWYPVIQRLEAQQLPKQLAKVVPDNWLDVALTVSKPPQDGLGLYGSGVFVINPPWTLRAQLHKALPWLKETLAVDSHAQFRLEGQNK